MRLRRTSLLALMLPPAVATAVACGSSSSVAPDAGAGDSGSPDVSVEDTGTIDSGAHDSSTSTDGPVEASDAGGSCPAFDAGTPFVEATHAPLPTMKYYGGPVLTAPQVISFTFSNTANVAALQTFGATITQTPWFADVTKDYCVNDGGTCILPGPTGLSVEMTATAATTYIDTFGQGTATGGTDLQAFINQQISAAVAASTIPAPGANSLYVFYFPSTSSISITAPGQSASSCSGFGGYHNNMTYTDGTTPIVYAILPDCAANRPTRELSSVTTAASHEIAEATTDSQPSGELGYYLDQPMVADAGVTVPQFRNDPWASTFGFGEVGDNCESVPAHTWPLDGGDIVQRIWSSSAAAAGHNPCVPVPAGETYYNASTDKALYVANVGDTFTVDVTAFSEEARASWRLDALDYTATQMTDSSGNPVQYLKFAWTGGVVASDGVPELNCVNNGTTGTLSVTLLVDPSADSSLANEEWPEADGVILSADVANPINRTTPDGGVITTLPYQFWPFAVITPKTAGQLGVTAAGVADGRQLAALRAVHRASARAHRVKLQLPPQL